MGAWGYFEYPTEPRDSREESPTFEDRDWWEAMAEEASASDFIEQEMSYEDAMAESEEIATDEGGWGAWMGGEL